MPGYPPENSQGSWSTPGETTQRTNISDDGIALQITRWWPARDARVNRSYVWGKSGKSVLPARFSSNTVAQGSGRVVDRSWQSVVRNIQNKKMSLSFEKYRCKYEEHDWFYCLKYVVALFLATYKNPTFVLLSRWAQRTTRLYATLHQMLEVSQLQIYFPSL